MLEKFQNSAGIMAFVWWRVFRQVGEVQKLYTCFGESSTFREGSLRLLFFLLPVDFNVLYAREQRKTTYALYK